MAGEGRRSGKGQVARGLKLREVAQATRRMRTEIS